MIVIVGGGPAGRIASIRLANAGKQVTLVESGGIDGIGGQCLHNGCMPVCALNDVARFIRQARSFNNYGITDSSPALDFTALLREMRKIQQKIASILDQETRSAGVEIVYGKHGRLEGRQVFINDNRVESEAVIAATGSRPNIPKIEGITLRNVYNPHTLQTIPHLPHRISIIGGGVMAAEFAYIFASFGSDVTLISRSIFLKNVDRHIRSLAIKELADVKIIENAPVLSLDGCSQVEGVRIGGNKGEYTIPTNGVFIAAGLIPRSEALEGLKKGPIGEIIVDNHMRTSVPSVYAAGDVTGPPYLTPVARHQGTIAADNILGIARTIDYRFIPQSINLDDELAFCTIPTEKVASMAIPGPAGPGTFWHVPSGTTGLAKVMVEPDEGIIRGICAVGPGGGIIASYLAFLMQNGFTTHDFEDFIEVHPSTDGVYGLLKYTSELLKRRGPS